MLTKLKKKLYFLVAGYFLFCAKLQLHRWKPKTFIVTGSSGKTTTMHLVQAQLGNSAHYSFHANSIFGIAFDVLGMSRKTLLKNEWIKLFLLAPIKAFKKPYSEKIYIAEVDCDRPKEGAMIARLLQPEGVVWLSSGKTHGMNFDAQVKSGEFKTVEAAVAHAFSRVAIHARELLITNSDSGVITEQLNNTQLKTGAVRHITMNDLKRYAVDKKGTRFDAKSVSYVLQAVLPREVFYSLEATRMLCEFLGHTFDSSFQSFQLPPGRSSLFNGINNTTIIDSSYNSSADAFAAMMHLFQDFAAKKKWLVVGDVLEQGSNEEQTHRDMATLIAESKLEQVLLVGPRLKKYTYPTLLDLKVPKAQVVVFEQPKDALDYLRQNLNGSETILFKGARFLEGIIEHLLADKKDISKLCRREIVWQRRRKEWGL